MFEDAPASNPFNVKVQDLTVGALVELVAVLLVGVKLEPVGFWAWWVLGGCAAQAEENESKCLHGDSAKSTGLHCTALHSGGGAAIPVTRASNVMGRRLDLIL